MREQEVTEPPGTARWRACAEAAERRLAAVEALVEMTATGGGPRWIDPGDLRAALAAHPGTDTSDAGNDGLPCRYPSHTGNHVWGCFADTSDDGEAG